MLNVWKAPSVGAGSSRHSQNAPFSPIPPPTTCTVTSWQNLIQLLEDTYYFLYIPKQRSKTDPQRTCLYLAMKLCSFDRWLQRQYVKADKITNHIGFILIFKVCGWDIWLFKNNFWDFLGGAVVKNLPANAGDTGSSPGLGRSHMPPSPCATTTEPALYSPRATTTEAHAPRACALQQEKPPQWEARAPQRRAACARQRRPNTARNKLIN